MNISEIAEMAGVSRAAVSRYFNNGYISEEKREQIRRVVEETGYIPSAQAQMLRTKKTKLIGVILPKIDSESVSQMVAGIGGAIRNAGYQILLADTENDAKKEIEYLNIFDNDRVDGVILVGTVFTRAHKRALKELKIPVVILGQHLGGYNCVFHDDSRAAAEVTELLVHERPGCVGYVGVTSQDEAAGKHRLEGFLQTLEKHGLDCGPQQRVEADFTLMSGYEKAKELLTKSPDTDAIFCSTDTIAIGVLKYLREIGKRVPQDVAVTGIGANKMGDVTTPTLSTVKLFYEESGAEAAQMILDALDGRQAAVKALKMGYTVIKRESTR